MTTIPKIPAEHCKDGHIGDATLTISGQIVDVYTPAQETRWPTLRIAITTPGQYGGTGELRVQVSGKAMRDSGATLGDLVSLTATGKGKQFTRQDATEVRMVEWSAREIRVLWSASAAAASAPADDSDMPF